MDFSGFLENNHKILDFVNRGENCPGYFLNIFVITGLSGFLQLETNSEDYPVEFLSGF